jgi:hypothetical protein
MTEVIAAISAAMTTAIAVYANVHVMRLCRKASREGCAVEARFGLLPSLKIDQRHHPNAIPEEIQHGLATTTSGHHRATAEA